MLIDDLREALKAVEPDIQTIKNYWANSGNDERFQKLETISRQEDFWQNKDQIEVSKELQALRLQRDAYNDIISRYIEAPELIDLFGDDESELKKLESDIRKLCRQINKFKIELLLNEPEDKSACFVNINAGAGGTESQDWASMLFRMYLRFCEREGLKVSIVDAQSGEEAGIKSATLHVTGKNAYGLLKVEHGIHRFKKSIAP